MLYGNHTGLSLTTSLWLSPEDPSTAYSKKQQKTPQTLPKLTAAREGNRKGEGEKEERPPQPVLISPSGWLSDPSRHRAHVAPALLQPTQHCFPQLQDTVQAQLTPSCLRDTRHSLFKSCFCCSHSLRRCLLPAHPVSLLLTPGYLHCSGLADRLTQLFTRAPIQSTLLTVATIKLLCIFKCPVTAYAS